jgi:elongation factor 1-gamma
MVSAAPAGIVSRRFLFSLVCISFVPAGNLFDSNAIARYIARIRRDTELAGRSFFETAQVDAWMEFCSHEVDVPATTWIYPVLGYAQFNAAHQKQAEEGLHKALATLERHLLPRTFVVGNSITLADISLAASLYYPFRFVLDAKARTPYPSVVRWFMTCVNQPAFKDVLGEVTLCTEVLTAAKAGAAAGGKKEEKKEAKKEEKPKAEAKKEEPKPKKKKDDDDDDGGDDMAAFAEPKKANPLDALPPSSMVLDEWKRTYSNMRTEGYYPSMPWFWEHLDRAGYTLFEAKYKYNEENKVDWQTSNLVGGFIQRCDEVRKYAFGSMVVLGDAAPFEVSGIWLMRGKDIKPMLEANPDAEYYEWTVLDPEDAATRTKVADYWCAAEKIGDKAIYDSKIFK